MKSQIVWFFGQSAAGKSTVIRNLQRGSLTELRKGLGLTDLEIRICEESLKTVGRADVVQLVPSLPRIGVALLIRGQTDDLNDDRVRKLRDKLPEFTHRIIFVVANPHEVLRRWREVRSLKCRSEDDCRGELTAQQHLVNKLEMPILCVDATARDYKLIPWSTASDILERCRALKEIEDALGERQGAIKDGREQRLVDGLIGRAFHPQCDWEAKHQADLFTLAVKPETVGWRFKISERLHHFFHHHYRR